ncbi:MAG: 2-oxoacid:acceptor oxidoreductase family protein [Candidatus Colwellbacteria bacterium]|nr:2-oxoacid:acceptor oxidoreductase family protein [Candidatus Colwellbacteria bacterium]
MRRTVIFAGQAGSGVDKTASIFAEMLAAQGLQVFIYRDYSSLIRGGHNFSTVTFGEGSIRSHDRKADALVVFNKDAIDPHRDSLIKGGLMVTSGDYSEEGAVIASGGNNRYLANNSSLGIIAGYFGLDKEKARRVLAERLGPTMGSAGSAFEAGYDMTDGKYSIRGGKRAIVIMDGSEAVARAAIDMGLKAAFYYPMTPATGVFAKLVKMSDERPISVVRTEDEIAAAMATIGAGFSGVRAMTGSSGGGLALMGEAVSLSGMAEVPLVIYAAQRTGPSTGVPTYTAQGDIKFILSLGPGEFPKFVAMPGDAEESYELTAQAFYFADKYRIPSFILSDKHVAESYFSVLGTLRTTVPKKMTVRVKPVKGYQSYKIDESGFSPMAIPGSGNLARATSYEHDAFGATIEDAEAIKKMTDKRIRKSSSLASETADFSPIVTYGKGSKVIVGAGSVKGAILDALEYLPGWKFVQIRHIEPFPTKAFTGSLKSAKEVVIVESNSTGLLASIIREKTGVDIKKKILKYDGRPFAAEEIVISIGKKR